MKFLPPPRWIFHNPLIPLILVFALSFPVFGQCPLFEEDFEATGCPSSPCQYIDDDSCLPGWATTHGAAHLSKEAAFQGSRSLRLFFDYSPAVSQGAILNFAFQANTCYLLNFRKATGGLANDGAYGDLNFSLVNGLSLNPCGGASTPSNGPEVVFNESVESSSPGVGPWSSEVVTFTPSANFSQLWIQTILTDDTEPNGTKVFIDNLTIQPFDAGFEFSQAPGGCFGVQFTSNCTEGVHSWDFGYPGGTSNEVNPVHSFPNAQTYTVTHSVATPCGTTMTETVNVAAGGLQDFVIGSLSPDGFQSLQDAIDNYPGFALNIFTVGQSILVQGELDIDLDNTNHIFSDCEIYLDAGAGINVIPGNGLGIWNSEVRGCGQRWRSIDVPNDATLSLVGNHRISDGQRAVEMHSKGNLECRGNFFVDNYVGIFKGDPFGGPNSFIQLGMFEGNTFTSTGALLPHFDASDPNDGPRSYAGLEFYNQALFTCGGSAGGTNTFQGLRNGILIFNGTLDVRNTEFGDMSRNSQHPISGFGIYMDNSTTNQLIQDGFGKSGPFSFWNCHTGIYASRASVMITDNNMRNMENGVLLEIPERQVEVERNTIQANNLGIETLHASPNTDLRIDDNDLDMTDDQATGISLQQNNLPPTSGNSFEIKDNLVRLYGAKSTGIFCLADRETYLRGNTVIGLVYGAKAFDLDSSADGILRCNSSNCSGVGQSTGFSAWDTDNVTWSCNTAIKSRQGIVFSMGGMTPDQFTGNYFDDCHYGLRVTSSGDIGTQEHRGNRWATGASAFSGAGARHDGTSSFQVQGDRFTVHEMDALPGFDSEYYPTISVVSPVMNGDFFTVLQGTPNTSCEGSETTSACDAQDEFTGGEDPKTRKLDSLIAEGGYEPGEFVPEKVWLAERHLYRKLMREPQLVEAGSDFEGFMDEKANHEIGQLYAMEEGIKAMMTPNAADATILDTNFASISTKVKSISHVDEQLLTASGQDSLDLLSQRAALMDELENLSAKNDALFADIQTGRASVAEQLLAQNEDIGTESQYGKNEQTVNEVFLKSVANGGTSFDPSHVGMLEDIAHQCPIFGGSAVFRARSLLALVGEYEFDDEACEGIEERGHSTRNQMVTLTSSKILITPNPASGAAIVRLPKEMAIAGMTLTTATGRQVMSLQFDEKEIGSFSFSVEGVVPGMYICSVRGADGVFFSEKLVVTTN